MPTFTGSSKKAREFQKNIYFCFIDYAKAFDCVDHSKLRKILKEMGRHARRKENVGQSVGDESVHLLGRVEVEGAYSGHEVGYLDSFVQAA